MISRALLKNSIVWYHGSYHGVLSILNTLRSRSEKLCWLTEAYEDESIPSFLEKDYYLESSEHFQIIEIQKVTGGFVYPDKLPECKVVEKYCFSKDDQYFLMEGMDLSSSYSVAREIRSNNASITIFSSAPGASWVEAFLKSDITGAGRVFEECLLNNQEEIIERFEFSLYTGLPDWDCDYNGLIVSKNQELLKELRMNSANENTWEELKMNMFPTVYFKEKEQNP